MHSISISCILMQTNQMGLPPFVIVANLIQTRPLLVLDQSDMWLASVSAALTSSSLSTPTPIIFPSSSSSFREEKNHSHFLLSASRSALSLTAISFFLLFNFYHLHFLLRRFDRNQTQTLPINSSFSLSFSTWFSCKNPNKFFWNPRSKWDGTISRFSPATPFTTWIHVSWCLCRNSLIRQWFSSEAFPCSRSSVLVV